MKAHKVKFIRGTVPDNVEADGERRKVTWTLNGE